MEAAPWRGWPGGQTRHFRAGRRLVFDELRPRIGFRRQALSRRYAIQKGFAMRIATCDPNIAQGGVA